ncbi:MAG: hypothetical protein WAX04_04760 [Oscillospiraceae bacterium]
MKTKELYLWQMINIKKSLYIFYSIIYAIYVVSFLISKISGDIHVGGMGVSSGVFMLVTGIVFFGETFKFGLCNGVSRKTIIVTQVVTLLSLSLAMTLIDTINAWLFSLIVDVNDTSGFYAFYHSKNVFELILWTFGIYLLFGTIGHFIATLNSRLTKFMKMLVYIPISVLLVVGLPLGISVLSASAKETLFKFISNVFTYLKASPYNMMLVAIIIAVIVYLLSILLVRKAPLKTV